VQTRLVVIQPTSLCNINCRYCYLPQRNLNNRISDATLEQIFKALFASSSFLDGRVTCVWHAGEPLVLSTAFYRRAFAIQQKWNSAGIAIINSFQTNATLITQEWCDFILEQHVRIGVSIDGPQFLHNAQRVDWANHGTFEHVMRGIQLLKANNIPFSVISVVTGETVLYPDEFWHFFMEVRPTRLGLNPEEVEGCNTQSSLHTPAGMQRYQQFLKRLLVLNEQSDNPLPIREIDTILRRIKAGRLAPQVETNTAAAILNFDTKGNISTFSPELLSVTHPTYGSFTLGNVFDTPLEQIFTAEKFIKMNTDIQNGIERCRESCEYFLLCGGGAPSNKLYENGTFDSTETNACRLRIKLTSDMLLDYLEQKYYLSAS